MVKEAARWCSNNIYQWWLTSQTLTQASQLGVKKHMIACVSVSLEVLTWWCTNAEVAAEFFF